jgi:hypothetical protein
VGLQQLTAGAFSITYIIEVMQFRDLKLFERKRGDSESTARLGLQSNLSSRVPA